MMKRFISVLLVLVTVMGLLPVMPANMTADAASEGIYTYDVIDGKATITKVDKSAAGKVTVPSKLGGYTVAAVGNSAFYGCSSMTEVILPTTVQSIGAYAFQNCSAMTAINIPNGVTGISWNAFYKCSSLKSMTLPASIKTIGNSAFAHCTSLQSINLPAGVADIQEGAFYNCSALASVSIPDSVRHIGHQAFFNTAYYNNPASWTSSGLLINNNAFICAKTTFSGDYAFKNGTTVIGDNAFYNCSGLTGIIIPASVDTVSSFAFYNCDSLKSVIIPDNITTISQEAFYDCDNLEKITIGKNVSVCGSNAFKECTNLKGVYISDLAAWCRIDFKNEVWESYYNKSNPLTMAKNLYLNNTLVKELVIPAGITEIKYNAFRGCESITSIVIPDSVKSIGDYSFAGCKNVTAVTIPKSVTSISTSAFSESGKPTIRGYKGSYAETFANTYGYPFVDITPTTTTTTTTTTTKKPTTTTTTTTKKPTTTTTTTTKKPTTTTTTTTKKPTTTTTTTTTTKKPTTTTTTTKKPTTTTITTTKPTTTTTRPVVPGTVNVERVAGGSRTQTAVAISKKAFRTTSTVILADGNGYADSLAGVPLAYALNAPILLVRNSRLDADTIAEIQRLGANKVIILGGELAINKDVVTALNRMGIDVERIAGKSRFDTAVEIAKRLEVITGKKPSEVFFAYSHNYADALSVGGVAAAKKAPILYIAANGVLSDGTKAYLQSSGAKTATILGGILAVSEAAEGNIGKAGPKTVNRVFGKSRYATCIEINKAFETVFGGVNICVATGTNFPDALAGGVFAAKNNAPLVLVPTKLTDVQTDYIDEVNPSNIYIFGGTGAVSAEIENDLKK